MGQSGGRRLDSDVRQLHRRVRPPQGSWGSRQFSSIKHVHPSPRASTDLSATLSSHNLGCNEVFTTTTTAGGPMHSSIDGHSDTGSCRAQTGGVSYSALPRRGAHRRIPRRRVVAVSYDGEPSRRPAGAGTGPSRFGGAVASYVRRRRASVIHGGRETRHSVPRCNQRWTQLRRTTPGSLLISLVVTARSPLSGCSS
jgi:hypothetical protein